MTQFNLNEHPSTKTQDESTWYCFGVVYRFRLVGRSGGALSIMYFGL